jgi:hypothetical protein
MDKRALKINLRPESIIVEHAKTNLSNERADSQSNLPTVFTTEQILASKMHKERY